MSSSYNLPKNILYIWHSLFDKIDFLKYKANHLFSLLKFMLLIFYMVHLSLSLYILAFFLIFFCINCVAIMWNETEMGPIATDGDKMYEPASNTYKEMCLRDDNCNLVCKIKGFQNGDCKGFLRKCIRTKSC